MKSYFRAAIAYVIVLVMGLLIFAPAAAAITYHLPELTSAGKPAALVIGRLGNGNTLPVPQTTAKLIYANVPDRVQIFDGPFCRASENAVLDNHTYNNACNDPNINYQVYYDFQALNNETGVAGPVKRVLGSSLVDRNVANVNLSDLVGVVPSTDGKYFVRLIVSWAKQNPASCTAQSTAAQGCLGGTNAFGIIMPRTTDLATYPANNTDDPNVPALAVLATGQNADPHSNLTFQFAPKCNASGAALRQKLAWEDADFNQGNQQGSISWALYDDTTGGPPIASRSNAQLGGQGEYREVSVTFQLNHKYRWVWSHVDNNNGVNVYIPYDGYDYLRTCSTTPPPPPPPPPGDPVVTRPYFNVMGGDVSAGQGMSIGGTDCALGPNDKAGVVSWNRGSAGSYGGAGTQYAAYVLNHLQEFSTAQGDTTGSFKPTGLSFANDAAAGINLMSGLYGGKFGAVRCTDDYFAGATNVQAGDRKLSELPGFPVGGNIANGSSQMHYIDGDLYIDSDIRFSGNYGSLRDIPYFSVVVRGDIYIDRIVSRLDGIYTAQPSSSSDGGNLYTCASDSAPPFTPALLNRDLKATCSTSLTFNGAVTAKRLWLLRTGGDVNTTAAETFNYTPEMWLSSKPGATEAMVGGYDAITSLPPVL